MINNTLNTICKFLNIPQALLLILDENNSSIICCNEWLEPGNESFLGKTIRLEDDTLKLLKNFKPTAEQETCLHSNNPVYKEALSHYRKKFKNFITVPIFAKGKIGWLLDFSREDKGRNWDESEINFVLLFANILCGVFERDKMEQQTSIVENSPNIIFYTDLDGKLSYANPAVAAVTGYTLEEIHAGGFGLIFDEEIIKKIKTEYIPKTLARGVDRQEQILLCKNGEKRILEIVSFIMMFDEKSFMF